MAIPEENIRRTITCPVWRDTQFFTMKVSPVMSGYNVMSAEHALLDWFNSIGLLPQPFSTLEASADPYLINYSIDHHSFPIAWGEWHSLIFASAGGGKTALRAGVVQSCWIGQETNRPFPISYIPPFLAWGHISPNLDEHLSALLQAGTMQLLLTLAHHPRWFMRLSKQHQEKIRIALDLNLPGPLNTFIKPCQESQSLEQLRSRFSPALLPPEQPEPSAFLEFFEALENFSPSSTSSSTPLDCWVSLLEILLDILNFPAIYILLDSFDATQETATQPKTIANFFSPLMPHLKSWGMRKVFIKSFLPVETRPELELRHPALFELSQSVTLQWTLPLLSDMIRRRVYFASEGRYGSLAPFSLPDLREPEMLLAKEVNLLPREMLLLTKQVMIQAAIHGGKNPKISHQDVQAGIQKYRDVYLPLGGK